MQDSIAALFIEYLRAFTGLSFMKKTQMPLKALETGQVWRVEDSDVHIGVVGKRLVHYKMFKGQTKRAPISLSGKEVLEKYLRESKAVLLRSAPGV